MSDTADQDLEAVPILVHVVPAVDYEDAEIRREEDREGFREHALIKMPWSRPEIEVDEASLRLKDLKSGFERIQHQVESLMAMQSSPSESHLRITEVTAKLGISAKGGIGFIAEAGVEASLEVKFVRSSRREGAA
ncbi:Pepco domain-containing protein [Streptomyces echinatus]|uniref:Pepco domain-containing protein n=1 Tax=Streptomyces echinatus TaxID=67293 RepID=UPI00379D2C1B